MCATYTYTEELDIMIDDWEKSDLSFILQPK